MDDSHDIPGYAVNAVRAIRDAFVGNDNAHSPWSSLTTRRTDVLTVR